MVLYLWCICQYGLHAILLSHVVILTQLLAAEPRCTEWLLLPSHCLRRTILQTLYSMVWDWQISRVRLMFLFIGLSCSLSFCLLLFSFSILYFYWLVLWGWGLWTDRVIMALSHPCIANLFNNNINSNNNNDKKWPRFGKFLALNIFHSTSLNYYKTFSWTKPEIY